MGNKNKKNPWQKKLDWHFIYGGFISFYVKPSYRKQGVSKSMMQKMEQLQHKIVLAMYPDPENCITLTCRGLAQNILENSKLFYGVECQPQNNNYKANISRHCRNIYFEGQLKKSIGSF